MLITEIKVTIINKNNYKALVDINLNNVVCVKAIKIFEYNGQYQLSIPSTKINNKDISLVLPINKKSRKQLEKLLFQAYHISEKDTQNTSIFVLENRFRRLDFFDQEIQHFNMLKEFTDLDDKKYIIPFNSIDVSINKYDNNYCLAFVRIILDDIMAIDFLKIKKTKNNLMRVAFPVKKIGAKYKNDIFPINSKARQYLENVIFYAYNTMIENNDSKIKYSTQRITSNNYLINDIGQSQIIENIYELLKNASIYGLIPIDEVENILELNQIDWRNIFNIYRLEELVEILDFMTIKDFKINSDQNYKYVILSLKNQDNQNNELQYPFLPIGKYYYDTNEELYESAWENIQSAYQSKEAIICVVFEYNKVDECLLLFYHGILGYLPRDYLTNNQFLDIQYFIGNTIKCYVTDINKEKNVFYADRLKIERDARQFIKDNNPDVECMGVVRKIGSDKSYALVDIMEGNHAFLGFDQISFLPRTGFNIDDVLRKDQIINGYVTIQHNNNNSILFFMRIKNYILDFQKMSSELKKGQIISGLLRQDILEEDIYYLRFNNYFCVKIQYEYLVNKDDVFDVEITSIDHENEEIHGKVINKENNENLKKILKPSIPENKLGSLFEKSINAVVSPYAYRANETYIIKEMEFKIKTRYSYGVIENLIKEKIITKEHLIILQIINDLHYTTTKHLRSFNYTSEQYLHLNSDKFFNRINSLKKRQLIEIYNFKSSGDTPAYYNFYKISGLGKKVIKNIYKKTTPGNSYLIDILKAERIKGILAANQFFVSCKERISSHINYHVQCKLRILGTQIKPTSIIEFEKSIMIIESIRNCDDEKERILEKCERYDTLFNQYKMGTLIYKNQDFLKKKMYYVFIGEDFEHTKDISHFIKDFSFSKEVFYTYDLLIFMQSPEFALYRFVDNESDAVHYYSIADLVKENTECFTSTPIYHNQLIYENYTFNSFPKMYLKLLLTRYNEEKIKFINMDSNDSQQYIQLINDHEFQTYFELTELSQQKNKYEMLWEPRVFLLGNGGSGKTNFANVMAGLSFNINESKTIGVTIKNDLWKDLPWLEKDGYKIDYISVWDFAGQEMDQIISNYLIQSECLCIIVLDSRHEDYPDHWLKYISTYAPHAKIMIVLNKIDDANVINDKDKNRYSRLDVSYYYKTYKNLVGIYNLSCKNVNHPLSQITLIKKTLVDTIQSIEQKYLRIWDIGINEFKLYLQKTENGYIDFSTFAKKYKEYLPDSKFEVKETLKLLDEAGICIYRKEMGTTIIIKPDWLVCALNRLLKFENYSYYKWELTSEEIYSAIENNQDGLYQYQTGESMYILEILEKIKICIKDEDDHYIFPCFFAYSIEDVSYETFYDKGNCYEYCFEYTSIPVDLFPSLQVAFWQYYKELIAFDDNNAYLPNKKQLYFILENHRMLIKKEENCIYLAIEMKNQNLNKSETDTFNFAKRKILDLNKRYFSNSKHISEYVVIRGREQNMNMKFIRYKYSIENLRKISIRGIDRRYFPVVDEFYDTSDLLLKSYTLDEIKAILLEQMLVIYEDQNNSNDEFGDSLKKGMAVYIPYNSKWYIVTTLKLDSTSKYYAVDHLERSIDLKLLYKEKVTIFEPVKKRKIDIPYPKIKISLGGNVNNNNFVFYFQNDKNQPFIEVKCELSNASRKVFICDNIEKLKKEVVGSIIFDIEARRGIGIISRVIKPNLFEYIDIDEVFKTFEKLNLSSNDKRG